MADDSSAGVWRERIRMHERDTPMECHYELGNDPALIPPFIAHLQEQVARMLRCDENRIARIGVAGSAVHHDAFRTEKIDDVIS